MYAGRRTSRGKREEGVALMLAVLLLVAVSALAMSTMQTVATDGQVAGFQNQEAVAFYAAEAGIADACAVVRNMGACAQVPDYPADFPDAANPVELSVAAEFATGELSRCRCWLREGEVAVPGGAGYPHDEAES